MASRLLVHFFFCLTFAVVFSLSVIMSGNNDVVLAAVMSCLYLLVCTYVGRWYGRAWLNRAMEAPSLLTVLLTFQALVLGGAAGAAYLFKRDVIHYFLPNLTICFPISLLFVLLGMSVTLARHTLRMQVTDAQIAQQQKESELRLLLSQLSPHFLFNTLNNMYGISLTQPQRVPNLLLKLSELLRYSVYETREAFIPLSHEILYLKNYLDFETIQTGDKLALYVEIDEIQDDQTTIAPMLLIVFVENAFKYAKATRRPNGFITIKLSFRDGWIYFTIKNSCEPGHMPQAGFAEPSGIGLHHTLKRLNLIYGQQYAYEAGKDGDQYAVALRLKADKL